MASDKINRTAYFDSRKPYLLERESNAYCAFFADERKAISVDANRQYDMPFEIRGEFFSRRNFLEVMFCDRLCVDVNLALEGTLNDFRSESSTMFVEWVPTH